MYYVYRLSFDEGVYIGCTNKLRRRKDQHNENARNKKSKIGCYLNEKQIVLKTSDFTILFESEDRNEALRIEKEEVIKAEKEGHNLLNDNYTKGCSRKGKHLGNTSLEWAVIDCKEHTLVIVEDLRQYCINKGLNYRLLHRTAKGAVYADRYMAFHLEDWANMTNQDEYISGEYVKRHKEDQRIGQANSTAKNYEVRFPDMHTEIVKNLDAFAREHKLTSGTLHATYTKNKPTKGYQVIRRI